MLRTISEKIEKADIINVSAIVALLVFVGLVIVNVYFVSLMENPAEGIKNVIPWAMAVVSSIFLAYGITNKKE